MRIDTGDYGSKTSVVEEFRQNHQSRKPDPASEGVPKDRSQEAASAPDKMPRPDPRQPFSGIDTRRDAYPDNPSDQAAFDTMHGRRVATRRDPTEVAKDLLNRLDSNADSGVTQDELAKVLKEIGQEDKAEKLFQQMDGDEDGTISQAEVEGALQSMLERMKSEQESRQTDDGGNWARYGPSGAVNAPPSALGNSTLDTVA